MNQRNVPDPLLSKLSKSERRMFGLLERNGPTPTNMIQSICCISNPADTKKRINRKAEELGDPRRITCTRKRGPNQVGEPTDIGIWKIDIQSAQTAKDTTPGMGTNTGRDAEDAAL